MLTTPSPAPIASHLRDSPAANSMISAIMKYWIAMPVSPELITTAPIIMSVCSAMTNRPRHSLMCSLISEMCAASVKMKISLPSSPGCKLVTPRLSHARWPLTSTPSGVNSSICRPMLTSTNIFHQPLMPSRSIRLITTKAPRPMMIAAACTTRLRVLPSSAVAGLSVAE